MKGTLIMISSRLTSALCVGALICGAAFAQAEQKSAPQNEEAHKAAKSASNADGEQLWSAYCGHCHNKISPERFSDGKWTLIARHMRIRANLTGEEERQIVEFLKTAN